MKTGEGSTFEKESALVSSFDINTVAEMTSACRPCMHAPHLTHAARAFWSPFVALDESATLLDAMLLLGVG